MIFAVPNSFVPNVPRIAYAATFFLVGMCMTAAQSSTFPRALSVLLLVGAGASAFVTTSLAPLPAGTTQSVELAFAGLATGWLSVLGTIGLVSTTRIQLPAAAARLTQFAYPIYVIHLPIVCAVQVLVYPWPLHATFAMALSFVSGVGISWLLVEAALRSRAHLSALLLRAKSIPAERWATAALAFGMVVRLVQYRSATPTCGTTKRRCS